MMKTMGLWTILCAGAAAVAQVMPATEDAVPGGFAPFSGPMGGPEALGDVLAGPFNLETQQGAAVLGVEVAWGFMWVSARANPQTVGTPHTIAQYRLDGTFVRRYNQPVVQNTFNDATNSVWGARDGAADEANNKLYFGHELGFMVIYNYDPNTQMISHDRTVQIPGLISTIRALCLRADNGNFLCADFGSPITEFTLNGVVTQYANNLDPTGASLAFYGMAWVHDGLEANDKLWGWSQEGVTAQAVLATEIDMSTVPPTRTGREFQGFNTNQVTNIAGGADADCENGNVRLYAVHQTVPDSLFVYDLDTDCGGGCEACACNVDVSTGVNTCDIFDFLGFQNLYDMADPCACDVDVSTGPGVCDIFDFLGFQNAYDLHSTNGCP